MHQLRCKHGHLLVRLSSYQLYPVLHLLKMRLLCTLGISSSQIEELSGRVYQDSYILSEWRTCVGSQSTGRKLLQLYQLQFSGNCRTPLPMLSLEWAPRFLWLIFLSCHLRLHLVYWRPMFLYAHHMGNNHQRQRSVFLRSRRGLQHSNLLHLCLKLWKFFWFSLDTQQVRSDSKGSSSHHTFLTWYHSVQYSHKCRMEYPYLYRLLWVASTLVSPRRGCAGFSSCHHQLWHWCLVGNEGRPNHYHLRW